MVDSHRASRYCRAFAIATIAALSSGLVTSAVADQGDAAANVPNTATPIKHLVVVIGENRGFDHI